MSSILKHIAVCYLTLLSYSSVAASPPNILFILVDDASPESFSAYGIADIGTAQTPNIDSIAQQGVIFATALAPAICQPSRVQIMTGKYATKTGNYYNGVWQKATARSIYQTHVPFSKVLQQAGYATAVAGKWDAGVASAITTDVGFDQYFIYSHHNQIKRLPGFKNWGGQSHYEEPPHKPSRYWYPSFTTNVKYDINRQQFTDQRQNKDLFPSQLTDFGPNLEAQFLGDFIKRSVAKKQPFLAYWPTVAPHGTGKGRLPTTPNRGAVGDLGNGPDGNTRYPVAGSEYLARYQALNQYLDQQIGQVLDTIKQLGISDNTIIIFASDNAMAVAGKTRGVERGSHVALMIAGAGIKMRKGLSLALTDTSDLAPTIIELAQTSSKSTFDGVSLVPFLTGQTDQHRPWIYANTAGSQILRTNHYLLEAKNQLYHDIPQAHQGRFYYTADHRFGRGYQLISAQSSGEHLQQRLMFQQLLQQASLSPLLPAQLSTNILKKLTVNKDTRPDKHLFDDKYHKFYDQRFSLVPLVK